MPFSFKLPNLPALLGKLIYRHNGKDNNSGAFLFNEVCTIKLCVPGILGATNSNLLLYNENQTRVLFEASAEWCDFIDGYDIFTFDISTANLGEGLYFYRVVFSTTFGDIFCYPEYGGIRFSKECPEKLFQFSVSNFKYPLPNELLGGIIYHIFVDRFSRGGEVLVKEGALLVDDWSEGVPEYPEYPGAYMKNNTFWGGTLYGVISKLDYISSLGVTAIYLSPIFDSPSNHKYDTSDYLTVDSMFGGIKALNNLIEEARRRNIGIILDGVFNHTGSDSIYFNREGRFKSIGAYQSKSSPYYSWYDFSEYPNKYTSWWDIDILPRINTQIDECCNYFVGEGGVIDYYSSLGILGFRLDVADELSDEFIKKIKACLARNVDAPVLYGEVWEDASNKIAYGIRKRYFLGGELDGVMNYPLRRGIINFLKNGATEEIRYALTDVINNAPERIANMQMNFLGTHDTERILTALIADDIALPNSEKRVKRMSDDDMLLALTRLKLAFAILMTLPGVPSIFYGDEAGLEGYSDPFNRMPYPWGSENEDLLSYVKTLGKIRRDNFVYRSGIFKLLHLSSERLIFSRCDDDSVLITFINNSAKDFEITFDEEFHSVLFERKHPENDKCTVKAYTAEIINVTRGALLTLFD